MKLPDAAFKKLNAIAARLDHDYQPWKQYHRDLADHILPSRYRWLSKNAGTIGALATAQTPVESTRNTKILDSTGTKAARDLAAGMLNGITSPARPWFNLRLAGFPNDEVLPGPATAWLEEIRRRMLLILAESNFYNSMGMLLLDLVVFGTAAMLIYEDVDDVIRCYNIPVGEFRLGQDNRRDITRMSRSQLFTVDQLVDEFGLENCTTEVQQRHARGGQELFHVYTVVHLVEPNKKDEFFIPGGFAYREFYWLNGNNPQGQILRRAGFTEKPGGFPRWETIGSETYGLSPGMDALPDIIQLQHETLRKAEALDKMTDPPLAMDAALRNQRNPADPGSRFYVPSHSQAGARALYDVRMPLAELSADIVDVQTRIKEAFFNDLFRMISMLETVRTATEIDARREEKLILMGAVLERLENEVLDQSIVRVFGIMKRKELLPPPPPGYELADIEVQYVSILSDAQRSVGTGVIERYMQVVGNTAALVPEIKDLPDWEFLLRTYAARLSVPAAGNRTEEQMREIRQKTQDLAQMQQLAEVSQGLTGAARNLGDVEVGGGRNALQETLGL